MKIARPAAIGNYNNPERVVRWDVPPSRWIEEVTNDGLRHLDMLPTAVAAAPLPVALAGEYSLPKWMVWDSCSRGGRWWGCGHLGRAVVRPRDSTSAKWCPLVSCRWYQTYSTW